MNDKQLHDAAHNLEVAANTVAYCYLKRPDNFAHALREMGDAAETVRRALTATQQAAPSQGAGGACDIIGIARDCGFQEGWLNLWAENFHRFAAALLEASTQREQPAASKPQPQSTTPKCIGHLDKFGNFKRELPAWMTDEPGVNWREVADLQECTQLHERVAELEQTLAFLTGPKRPLPSVLVHTRLGADVLYDGVSWDKQTTNTLHVQVSSAALDAKTNRIIELERELKLKGQP